MKNAQAKAYGAVIPLLIAISAFGGFALGADVRRISSKAADMGKVHKLYLVDGLASVLIFPEPVTAVIPGNMGTLKIERKEPENLLALRLKGSGTSPTNLIVLTSKSRMVFDVIPNAEIHQDTLEISATYGGAQFEDSDMKLLYSGAL